MANTLFNGFPNPGDPPASSQPQFLQNNNYWPNVLGKDHQIVVGDTDATTNEGHHLWVGMLPQPYLTGNVPTVNYINSDGSTCEGVLFMGSNGELYIATSNGANVVWQLTTTDTSSTPGLNNAKFGVQPRGWTFLPGGLIMNYGYIIGPYASPNVPVVFGTAPYGNNIAFPNNFINVQLTVQSNSKSDTAVVNFATPPTNAGFTILTTVSGSSSLIYYVALGN